MNYFKLAAILGLNLMLALPLSALGSSNEESFPLENIDRLLIDQQDLRFVTIGISFYPVKTSIRGHNGSELLVRVNERSSFGFRNPVTIDTVVSAGTMRLFASFEHRRTAGINIGSLDLEILIPGSWQGELVLDRLKSKTLVEDLELDALSGSTSVTELTIEGCSFGHTDLELGTDTDLTVYGTDLGDCRLNGAMGKITAGQVRGNIDAETFDGDISIDFSGLSGETRLSSKLGKISVGLPEDTSAGIELYSRLGKVECGLSLSSSTVLKKNEIRGSIGAAGTANSLSLRSGDGDIILEYSAPRY